MRSAVSRRAVLSTTFLSFVPEGDHGVAVMPDVDPEPGGLEGSSVDVTTRDAQNIAAVIGADMVDGSELGAHGPGRRDHPGNVPGDRTGQGHRRGLAGLLGQSRDRYQQERCLYELVHCFIRRHTSQERRLQFRHKSTPSALPSRAALQSPKIILLLGTGSIVMGR